MELIAFIMIIGAGDPAPADETVSLSEMRVQIEHQRRADLIAQHQASNAQDVLTSVQEDR